MKAIILAAGKGTRMKSETPKVLHKIMNKTLLGYVLDNVNAEESFVIVGHHAEEVQNYVQTNYKNAKTVVKYNGEEIISKKRPRLAPGEMESVIIKNDMLKKFAEGGVIEISVEE